MLKKKRRRLKFRERYLEPPRNICRSASNLCPPYEVTTAFLGFLTPRLLLSFNGFQAEIWNLAWRVLSGLSGDEACSGP